MMSWPLGDEVQEMPPGLWTRRGAPPSMVRMHRHDDVEINVVLEGQLQYLFAGRPLTVRAGEIAVFWAAQPHGLVDSRRGDVCWVHVPFSMLLSWGLPEAETAPLLRAEPLVTHAPELAERIALTAASWRDEVGGPEPGAGTDQGDALSQIALLEIEAAVRRILRAASPPGTDADVAEPGASPTTRLRQVSAMAQHVREHHRSPLQVADIAAAAHLTPSHAMTVFRRTVGVTLGSYVTMCRIAEAQRLLLTTSMTTTEIASAAGFGSLSSFYAHVTEACGMAPRDYRRQGL